MKALFAYFDGGLEDFLTYIKEMKDNQLVKIKLAPAKTPEGQGVPPGTYYHVLDNFAVNHIMHRHGGKREYLRGQIPMTYGDLLFLPEIYDHYDSLSTGICKNGNPAIIYTKDIGSHTYTLIEEIRVGHSEMAASTLYKRKKKLTDAKSLENSADSGFASFCFAKVENNPEYPNKEVKNK